MHHQWREFDYDQDLEDLRQMAANDDTIEVGPFDDCDVTVMFGEDSHGEIWIGLAAMRRCEVCGGFDLSDWGEDYIAFVGPGDDWRNCLGPSRGGH